MIIILCHVCIYWFSLMNADHTSLFHSSFFHPLLLCTFVSLLFSNSANELLQSLSFTCQNEVSFECNLIYSSCVSCLYDKIVILSIGGGGGGQGLSIRDCFGLFCRFYFISFITHSPWFSTFTSDIRVIPSLTELKLFV